MSHHHTDNDRSNDFNTFMAIPTNDQMSVAYESVQRYCRSGKLPERVRDRYSDAVWLVRESPLLSPAIAATRRISTTFGSTHGLDLLPVEASRLVNQVTTELRAQMGLGLFGWLLYPAVWRGVEILVRLIVSGLLDDWWQTTEEPKRERRVG